MAETIHQRIERERKAVAPGGSASSTKPGKWEMIDEFRDYARGRQRKTLNADQVRIMQSLLKHPFADNVLRQIIWTHANRLRVARFDVDDDDVTTFLFDTWVRNQFPDLFADAVFACLRDGSHAISLNWRASNDPENIYGGRVVWARERWWNGKDGTFIMYNDDGQYEYAVKEWVPVGLNAKKRRTIYFDDRIQRYILDGGDWQPYTVPGEEDLELPNTGSDQLRQKGVVPWTKRNGDPLGIPFVHLSNGSDDDSYYGASMLDGGALAFQDQLNALQHDITAAALLTGSPQTWSKGFPLPPDPNDPTGEKKIPIQTGPGTHHHSEEVNAAWGVLLAGSLAELKNAYLTKLEALCRMTNTPLHEFTGQWPSGEAIFRAEIALVGAVRKLGESIGPSCSTLAHRSTEIQNAFGNMQLDENALIQTVFEPPEQRDELTRWAVAEKASPYVSNKEVLRIAGYQPDDIERITEERDEEKAEAVSMAQSAFSRPSSLDALQRASGATLTDQEDTSDDTE